MNRKLLGAVLASGAALFASGAMAADLPSEAPAPAPYIAPPPYFTWTGFYIGGVAGVNFGNSAPDYAPNFLPAGVGVLAPAVSTNAGFTGGLEAGYNYQMGQFVFGIEGDIDYLSLNDENGTFVAPAVYGAGNTYTFSGGNRNGAFGTIRGRLGWAIDRALLYVTGGAAFGGNAAPSSLVFTPGTLGCLGTTCQFTSNRNTVGAVVGGGIEYAFTNNWTAKVEYLHTFYGATTYTDVGLPAAKFTTSNSAFDTNIVRVGLNYKF